MQDFTASLTKLLHWMFIEWWGIRVFIIIITIIIIIIMIFVYVNYVTCVCAYGFPDEAVRSSGVAGDCEPPGVGPGSWAWVLWMRTTCFVTMEQPPQSLKILYKYMNNFRKQIQRNGILLFIYLFFLQFQPNRWQLSCLTYFNNTFPLAFLCWATPKLLKKLIFFLRKQLLFMFTLKSHGIT